MTRTRVEGKKSGDILLYALSTCVWCKMTKRLLNEMGVEYEYIDVDLLKGDERVKIEKELNDWNPRRAFPTLVINNEKVIKNYDEEEIRGMLDNE